MSNPLPLIDVRERIANFSMADCIRTADGYFRGVDRAGAMMKPFNDLGEAPEVILTFLQVVKGLRLRRGATVLDFGAGSCWTSRILAALGYRVIASDLSAAALDVGRELFARNPIGVDHIPPKFLLFDGRTVDLPDASVDAVCCISALHHVPNPSEVIAEFGRVLKPWGRAGFSEPGPAHSLTPQAQAEMREYEVIENNVVIEDLWEYAKKAGFSDIEIGLFYPEPFFMSMGGFKGFLAGDRPAAFEANMRTLMAERRLFILERGDPRFSTSMVAAGLNAMISTPRSKITASSGEAIDLPLRLKNTGTALWRPSDYASGPVRCGPSLVSANSAVTYPDRVLLTMPHSHGLEPGGVIEVTARLAAPMLPGQYELRLQMVAEAVAWFGEIAIVDLTIT